MFLFVHFYSNGKNTIYKMKSKTFYCTYWNLKLRIILVSSLGTRLTGQRRELKILYTTDLHWKVPKKFFKQNKYSARARRSFCPSTSLALQADLKQLADQLEEASCSNMMPLLPVLTSISSRRRRGPWRGASELTETSASDTVAVSKFKRIEVQRLE